MCIGPSESANVDVDAVKGGFIEGGQIYPQASFYEKTHIQVCVCNPECIKGVFRVPAKARA
jgi:hypothetical protein